METIKQNIYNLKKCYCIDRAYIFGSYLDNKITSNDIDIILFKNVGFDKNELNALSSNIPLSIIQYNCYKKHDKVRHNSQYRYDIVAIDKLDILKRFLNINHNRIIEV